jgi:hypothetical protein
MPSRRIEIEFEKTADGERLAELDLLELGRGSDWPWLLRELRLLPYVEILTRFEDAGLPAGPEGTWGELSLPPYLVSCQLLTGGVGAKLKVVRLFHRTESELLRKHVHAAARNDDVEYE